MALGGRPVWRGSDKIGGGERGDWTAVIPSGAYSPVYQCRALS